MLYLFKKLFIHGPIIIVLIILSSKSSGQATGDPKEDFLYGEYYLSQNLYTEALPFYLSALEKNRDNSNINYRIGLCYMKLVGEQQKAIPYLEKAVNEINMHYIEGKYNNKGAPVEAWLLLGDACLRDDQLMEASRAYHTYKDLIGDSDKEKYELIMKRISGLGISYEYQRDQKDFNIINMGENINSRFSDYNPVVSGDQKVMIYTQYWETYDRIMISHLTENGWSQAEDISNQVGSQGECYTSAISFDGKELYLICHDEVVYDIYTSLDKNGKWTKMKPISGKVNSRYRESSMGISADGKTLYFASDRPGGEGGFDLYTAQLKGSVWTDIRNLGKPVNTKGNEEAPYISYEGTVLYFSSNGHETVGNMDILYAELDEKGEWQDPVNMGVPVNTTNDDVFYIYFNDSQTGYFSRDLPQGFGKNDIYRLETGKNVILPSDGAVVNEKLQPVMVLSDKSADTAAYIAAGTISDKSSVSENTSSSKTESTQRIKEPSNNMSSAELPENNPEISSSSVAVDINTSHINKDKATASSQVQNGSTVPAEKTANTGNIETEINSEPDYNKQDMENVESNTLSVVEMSVMNKSTPDSIPTYTIQIYALRRHIDPMKIKLSPLKISPGNDGLYRYTYGEYIGYSQALLRLDKIRASGFPDAFIRNISTVQNYSGRR
jgi:tetratricopeptide (TPR) repeat protein